jgi:acetate kinase
VALLTGDVLVVNAGSTSLKLSLVGADDASRPIPSLALAPAVPAVGHRIVHGGARFSEPTPIDDAVLAELSGLIELAPLHNAPAVEALHAARAALPDATHVAVFDTAFHKTLPDVASTYLLPARFRNRGVRRYGFHGLSVQWVAERVPVSRLVVCHLGGGSSVTAVRDGRSIDTTMGFTPLEGLAMATRSGSIDPGLLLHLLIEEDVPAERLRALLNTESGLAGLSGTDGDMRQIEAAQRAGDHRARLAFAVYVHRLRRGIGAMLASLGGVDAIVFSGGVGENSEQVRREALAPFSFLGPIPELVIPAEEEWAIARSAATVVRAAGAGRSGSEVGAR